MNHPATSLQTLTDKLIARKEGAIGWIIFNNPERHNATSFEMWQALPVVLDAYARDPEVRVIIFKGDRGEGIQRRRGHFPVQGKAQQRGSSEGLQRSGRRREPRRCANAPSRRSR